MWMSDSSSRFRIAWCVFWLFIGLSKGAESALDSSRIVYASKADFYGDFYGHQNSEESLRDLGTTANVSAVKKLDLIRYYLGSKIPGEQVAVVVDLAEMFYENVKRLWSMIVSGQVGGVKASVMLFVYNDTDCNLVQHLEDGKVEAKEAMISITFGNAKTIFQCVNLALNMIQSDSSITLFTGRKTADYETLGESTALNMIGKRCEFNVIWCNSEPDTDKEVNGYAKIAKRTNGHYFQFTKLDYDELVATGVDRLHRDESKTARRGTETFFTGNGTLTASDTFTVDQSSSISSKDETADLLFDPVQHDTSGRMITRENEEDRKEALELEDVEKLAAVTVVESATKQETTVVEITAETSLVGRPGAISRITFRVTNNYPLTIRHYFRTRSTSFNVVYLQPRDVWIESGQTVSVVADVFVPTTATDSTTGMMTLIIQGIGTVEKSAYVYVRETGSTISDSTKPTITHSFNNNCAGKLGSGTCANSLWSVDVTIQDSDSGLQRVTSSPKGIQAVTTFVSGTKSSIRFQYAATCCQTTVAITAEDLLGNGNSRTIDVTVWDNLFESEIAAIVLGTLLLLVIIVAIVLGIICCIRRRKKSQDLPYTQRYGTRPPRAERTSF